MLAPWSRSFVIGYGEDEQLLGTAPGGDSGSLDLGPEYGAQAPDGSWWFLDAAKRRVAHYDGRGGYLDAVDLPTELLVDGVYFQFQLPRVLDDGTLVANGLREDGTVILRVRDGDADQVEFDRQFVIRGDDGRRLYGSDDGGATVVVDIEAGTVRDVPWPRGPDGTRYRVGVEGRRVRVQMPDASPPVDRALPVVADTLTTAPLHPSLEIAVGADGTVHLLVVAIIEGDHPSHVAGYTQVRPDGTVAPVERVRDPFSAADPGSPAHLGVRPGSNEPWLMFVEEDGVHVYQRH